MTEYNKCIMCNNIFKTEELVKLHELRNVYNEIYSILYSCKKCNESFLNKLKEDEKINSEKERIELEEKKKMTHDSEYDSILEQKITDVLSNNEGEIVIILENRKRLYFSFSEWGSLDIY